MASSLFLLLLRLLPTATHIICRILLYPDSKNFLKHPDSLIESEFVQVQPYSLKSIFHSDNQRLSKTRKNIGKYYLRHPVVFLARIRSLFVDGLNNKYMTLVLRKP